MASDRFIVIFTRSPEAEARAKGLPRGEGTRLFRAVLGAWRRAAAETGARLLVVSPPADVLSLTHRLSGPWVSVEPQHGSSFGERLADAAGRAFSRGARSVLLAGCDCPTPSTVRLLEAFSVLESKTPGLLLAPASDGGLNLIGLNRAAPALLSAIVPGSPFVASATESQARESGFAIAHLPTAGDLDGLADVRRACRPLREEAPWKPFRTLLRSILGILAEPVHSPASAPSFSSARIPLSRAPPAA